jgi:hypothetical protein
MRRPPPLTLSALLRNEIVFKFQKPVMFLNPDRSANKNFIFKCTVNHPQPLLKKEGRKKNPSQ